MKIQLMNVQKQHEAYAEEYEEAALSVLRSGRYIGGEEVEAFEKEFAQYEGARYGIACGNGSDALLIACKALGIGAGDEVIIPAFTFFATGEAVAATGATPVFVDSDPKTYCIDISGIEERITNRTKAIMPVHFYGNCCEMDEIRRIAEKRNLYVVTDCAQSTGTEYNGSRKNTLGDVACFSFFPTKILGCDGDGGMLLTDDENIAAACRALRVHGSGEDGLKTLRRLCGQNGTHIPENMPIGTTKYYNYLVGYNSRLDAVQAAILRKKLLHIDEFVGNRRKIAAYYNEMLKDTSYMLPVESAKAKHSYYTYIIQHDRTRDIIKKLEERGIQSGVYYPVPLHLQGAFIDLGYQPGDFPTAELQCRTTFAVPVYPELTEEEREYIANALLEIDKQL